MALAPLLFDDAFSVPRGEDETYDFGAASMAPPIRVRDGGLDLSPDAVSTSWRIAPRGIELSGAGSVVLRYRLAPWQDPGGGVVVGAVVGADSADLNAYSGLVEMYPSGDGAVRLLVDDGSGSAVVSDPIAVPPGRFDGWLVVDRAADGSITGEVWVTDPGAGGAAAGSLTTAGTAGSANERVVFMLGDESGGTIDYARIYGPGDLPVQEPPLVPGAARPLTPLGLQMLGMLPPVLRGAPEYRAALHAGARELERLEAMIEVVRAQFNPRTADVLLKAWEALLRLPIEPAGQTVEERRGTVESMLRQLRKQLTGREWEQAVTALIGSSWSYEEHDPDDATSPPAYVVRVHLPWGPDSTRYYLTQRLLRDITPAHIGLELASTGGFRTDSSLLDEEPLGS